MDLLMEAHRPRRYLYEKSWFIDLKDNPGLDYLYVRAIFK